MDPERSHEFPRRRHRCAAAVAVAAASLLLAACEPNRSVITDLSMVLPEGDRDARNRLDGLEVEVWSPSLEACRNLIGWRRVVCGGDCTQPPSPRDEGESPMAELSLPQNADGTFSAQSIEVGGDGPWEVLVRGLDDTGDAFLYGCTTVASEEPATVRLFRPWCDTAACASQFHSACPVEIDCSAEPGDDPDGIGPPACNPLVPVVFAWEEGGSDCDPGGAGLTAPCRQARIECRRGMVDPVEDGVCPATSDPTCGGTIADDLDCDGRFPGPCEACSPGETAPCGTGACAPVATCDGAGTFGECLVPTGATETCDGVDEDCDGIADQTDADAFLSCNAGRGEGAPAADRCDGPGGCRCGSSRACGVTEACCGGVCVDVMSTHTSCGACGRECPSRICAEGMCHDIPVDGGVCTVESCNAERGPTNPAADNCAGGDCRCGLGAPCEAGFSCCADACRPGTCEGVDAGTPPDGCVPATETCGEGDEDCDRLADAVDPDALDWCNRMRTELTPRADNCGAVGCRCGDVVACADGAGCCDVAGAPACVSLETDANCGGCGIECAGATTCRGGSCS